VTDLYITRGLYLDSLMRSFDRLEYQYSRSLKQCGSILEVYKNYTHNLKSQNQLVIDVNKDYATENIVLVKENKNLSERINKLRSDNLKMKLILIVGAVVGGIIAYENQNYINKSYKKPSARAGEENFRSWDENNNTASFEYKGEKPITTLEDGLKFCGVDLDLWEVDRWTFNSWDVSMKKPDGSSFKRTNYQTKIWLKKRKDQEYKRFLEMLSDALDSEPDLIIEKPSGPRFGMLVVADIHFGADVRKTSVTEEFNVNNIIRSFQVMAEKINSMNYDRVQLTLLGDLIESITGLMHINTWQSMSRDAVGANAVVGVYLLLKKYLISKIKNLSEINVVSGNHDRISINYAVDTKGAVANLVSFMLMENTNIKINFDDFLLEQKVDGIHFLMTHGHHKAAKDDVKMIADYGDSRYYRILLKGHLHTRKKSTTTRIVYKKTEIVGIDELNYRSITCPSIFTGNRYSGTAGYLTSGGYMIIQPTKEGKNVDVMDFSL